jgi:hypothetical protein
MSAPPQKYKLGFPLHPRQHQVFECPNRFRVLVAGRRFGKSELALAELVRAALHSPNRLVWYVCPSDKQAKRIIWRRLKAATSHLWSQKPLETERRIDLKNKSAILVKGAFDPDSLRGDGLDFIVLDEVADLKSHTWSDILRPSLADRKGRALFIGTPKGRNHLYDYFELAKSNPDWASFQFTTEEGGLVDKSEIESAAREMDSNVFRRELEAQFTVIGDYRAYLAFDRDLNIREVRFEASLPLIWSLDFNVDPMCMLLMQRNADIVHVLEELVVRSQSTTTEDACRVFLQSAERYLKSAGWVGPALQVHAYGDASGHQRRTSAAATDWTLIRNFFRTFHTGAIELSCRYANLNPLVRDRINCVNARLRNSSGEPRLFISPGCKELIRDLEEVCFTVDSVGAPTCELNKSDRNRTHMSDALGYYISQAFPLRGTFHL